jgi:hypothetical protein
MQKFYAIISKLLAIPIVGTFVITPIIGLLIAIYAIPYYLAFKKSPMTVKKGEGDLNTLHIDFEMWKSIFIKNK